jgi:hypothetical protein
MKNCLIIVCFLLSTFFVHAQQDSTDTSDKPPLSERVFFGGDLGLVFGTNTLIDISPLVGYQLTPSLSIGGGPIYQYYKINTGRTDFETTIYGGRGIMRYYFSDEFFAHVEYQKISVERVSQFTNELQRVWVPLGLVGGGYLYQVGNNTYLSIQVLFDIIDDVNSPYNSSTFFRGGIIINPF